ncbi:DUF563 domain-containing protein [Acetobacter sp. LMG 1636]|uniref:DUF563 domain-containing protein n=2 Tax=Acetobacter fallax TaxID=1737473 RepID=A0ABX0K954_9PROT|nr:DUF563 domain-containing protein [Acetobacter fallax]NHO34905.1 DUF563 domain-containing protein [Acetobacter fallax]
MFRGWPKSSFSSSVPSDISLRQAAGRQKLIEYSPKLNRTSSASGPLRDGMESLFPGWSTLATPIFRYDLGPAVFDPSLTMFSVQGSPIRDILYTQPLAVLDAFHATGGKPVESSDQIAWAGFDHWNTNFYHWVAHTLPTICHFLKTASPDDVFLLPELTPWQQESIELMQLPRDRWKITQADRRYAFPHVVYTDFLRGRTDFTASETLTETSRLLRQAAGCSERPGSRLLFVERGCHANRRIPNEAELADGLKRVGFECVRPETLTVREQILLFSEARMVVGFLGAGLTNIAWCPPGTIVYELVPRHHQNPCFLTVAIRNHLFYWGELIETGVTQENHTSRAALPVDVGRVVAHARNLLSMPKPWPSVRFPPLPNQDQKKYPASQHSHVPRERAYC